MRVGVIRGDVPSPIFLADLEPTSGFNPPTEPFGQTRYVSRPDPTTLTNYMAGVYASDSQDGAPAVTVPIPAGKSGYGGVPAAVEGSAAVTFPVTITLGVNDTLQFKNSSAASLTSVVVAAGSYATMTALLAALNAVMVPTGFGNATTDSTGTLVVIQSSIPGVGSYIDIGAGDINATLHLAAPVPSNPFTMPSATTIITDLNPVQSPPATGAINVSAANILATLGAAPAAAGVADLIAPKFSETEVAVQSFQVGNLSKYTELSWNPDSRRLPAIANGPAIQVVEDDGHTSFSSSSLAALPMVTAAVHNVPATGDITITGVGLGNVEAFSETVVVVRAASSTVTNGSGVPQVRITQALLNKTVTSGTQGSVSNTSIVIPASLLTPVGGTGLGVVGSTVEVKYQTFANTNYGAAASVTAWSNGVSTLAGLAHQVASQVGSYITVSGAASPGNNGTFQILSWISATSITVANIYGVSGDGNNGALVWSEPPPVAFVVT